MAPAPRCAQSPPWPTFGADLRRGQVADLEVLEAAPDADAHLHHARQSAVDDAGEEPPVLAAAHHVEHVVEIEELEVPVGDLQQGVAGHRQLDEERRGVDLHHALEEDGTVGGIPRQHVAGKLAVQVFQQGQAGARMPVERFARQDGLVVVRLLVETEVQQAVQRHAPRLAAQAVALPAELRRRLLQHRLLLRRRQDQLLDQGRQPLMDVLVAPHRDHLALEHEHRCAGVGRRAARPPPA